jgi:hypothetical protein
VESKKKTPAVVRKESRLAKLEAIAYDAYLMELGKYPYPPGVPRGHKKPDGTHDWNKTELMRRFGWENSGNQEAVLEDEHFIKALEFHRWRGSDENFRKKVHGGIWDEIGENASWELAYRVKVNSKSMSTTELLKIMDTYIKGKQMGPAPDTRNKTDELLGTLDERERQVLMDEQKKSLERQLTELKSLEMAIDGTVEDV